MAPFDDPVDDDEVRALLFEVEGLRRKYKPLVPESRAASAVIAATILRAWLADRTQVSVLDLSWISNSLRSNRRWWHATQGYDPVGGARTQLLVLFSRMREELEATNKSDIATKSSHRVRTYPRRGIDTRPPAVVDSHAMTTASKDQLKRLLGRNARLARIAIDMTAGSLSRELGISAQRMSDYERGKVRIGDDRLAQIAEITGHSIGWFYEEHETVNEDRE